MAEGLTVSNVVDTKYRRYPKYPQWPLVQAQPVVNVPNTEYELSLNDSGNMLYITTNNNDHNENKVNDVQPHPDLVEPDPAHEQSRGPGHVSPRKWHHGDIRRDLMPEYHVRQYNRHSADYDSGQKSNLHGDPRHNNGQITIYYNGLDFVEGLANENDHDKVKKNQEIKKTANLGLHERVPETNFDQLKKEYINKSRAKEFQYNWLRKQDSRDNIENVGRAIIRYDIEAPTYSTRQKENIRGEDTLTDNRILHKAQEDERALKKEVSENSISPPGTASMTLPKLGAKFPRNTRFGSQGKVTAYRPSTRLDSHRQNKLHDIMESPINDVNLEEGRQLWAEVDAITREPLVPPPSPHRRKTYKSRDIHTSNNSVEFFPLFDREPQKLAEIENNLWHDGKENEMDHKVPVHSYEKRRNILDPSKTPEAINLGVYGRRKHRDRLSLNEEDIRHDKVHGYRSDPGDRGVRRYRSVPALQLYDQHGNMVYVSDDYNQTNNNPGVVRLQHGRRDNFVHPTYNTSGTEPFIDVPESGACKGQVRRMTTTLPRITPANTPLPPGICQSNPPRAHSSASMYGAYPPKDLSSSVDFLKIPGRINPLAPPPPRRRINWSWETSNQHWENEKRRILMQKREHTRYHSAWSKAFYGAPAEKEAYRRHYRDVLKQQMADRENSRKEEMINKVKETERAVKYDEQCRSNDAQEYFRKHAYLMLYRDGNKQQMEDKWAERRYNKVSEDRVDRERLRYNPINWSCSLK